MLPNALTLIFFLTRHLNLSATLPMNMQRDCLQCTYAQGVELKQVSPEIQDTFPRLVKAVRRAQASSES